MTLRLEVDRAALIALGTTPSGPVYQHMTRVLTRVDARAKQLLSGPMVAVRTGNLRSSQAPPRIVVSGSSIKGVIENTASYAIFVHEGTRPHTIEPRRVKVLTGWTFNGAPVFAKKVNHPGTKARPWLRVSLSEVAGTGGAISAVG